ncbi:MAG TPA: GntR family transcriptional regulator [Leptolyngbya sp.]|jgi:DNA-binding GntR family transcriptional regulator|nr:GntR family transcriptional regulator [Leptolyngbya sp.]
MPPSQSSVAPPKSTEELIYTELFDSILERRLPPETKLGENLLAEHYGVSRTIIRQVLIRLSHDQLIKLEPNRGAFVASLTLEQAKQIYAAWRLTESAIIEEVTQTITQTQIATLRSLVKEERFACEQKDIPRLTRLSAEFHMQLADLSENKYLARFLKALIPQTSLAFFYKVEGMPICTKDEHSEILDHIAAGDGAAAVQAVLAHLDGIESALNARVAMSGNAGLVDSLKARSPFFR